MQGNYGKQICNYVVLQMEDVLRDFKEIVPFTWKSQLKGMNIDKHENEVAFELQVPLEASPLVKMSAEFPKYNDAVEETFRPVAEHDFINNHKKQPPTGSYISIEDDIKRIPLAPFCTVEKALQKNQGVLKVGEMELEAPQCKPGCNQ